MNECRGFFMISGPSCFTDAQNSFRLLLVENNPADIHLVREALTQTGEVQFQITESVTLEDGLQQLSAQIFDVVILDLELPGSNGLDALFKISTAAPLIPIVVLTGNRDRKLILESLQNGAEDHLFKDQIDPRLLVYSLCHAIDRHRLRLELEQTRSQQLQHHNLESIAILAGGIAHHFNNILTVIIGNTEFILGTPRVSKEIQNALHQMKSSSYRAADLCKQLLAYSGKGKLVLQPLDVSMIVQETSEMFQFSMSKSINVTTRYADELPRVDVDVSQLRQMILNLLRNACEAIELTESDEGVITVTTGVVKADRVYLAKSYGGADLPEGNYVYIEVRDNGCGMDETTRRQLFEPFFSRKFIGRGLGLPAVYGIVRVHKGALVVLSEEGKGSTFRVLLPPSQAKEGAVPTRLVPKDSWHGKGTLLLVDDEENVRSVINNSLKNLGFRVLMAGSGKEAIDLFKSRHKEVDLVLLDMVMPNMNGEELYHELRRIRPDARVLVMSGYSEDDVMDIFAGRNIAGFIQKPFRYTELRDKIYSILSS